MEEIAMDLIEVGKDWLTQEYGNFNTLTAEIEIGEDIVEKKVQKVVEFTKKHKDVAHAFYTKYPACYTVTLQFK